LRVSDGISAPKHRQYTEEEQWKFAEISLWHRTHHITVRQLIAKYCDQCVTSHNKLEDHPLLAVTDCHSTYSQLPSISGGDLFLQPEDMPLCGDRDPQKESRKVWTGCTWLRAGTNGRIL